MAIQKFQNGGGVLPKGEVPDINLQRLGRDVDTLKANFGPAAFSKLELARVGQPEAMAEVARVLGRPLEQNDLASVQRFFEGERVAKDPGVAGELSSLALSAIGLPKNLQGNLPGILGGIGLGAGFETAKGASQAAGLESIGGPLGEAVLGGDAVMGPNTSQASAANVVSSILGTLSQAPLINNIVKGLMSSEFASNEPQAQTGIRGEHGGMIPGGKFTMRVPTNDLIQSFQSGGLVGDIISQLQGINVPEVGQVGQTAGILQGTAQQMLGTAGQVGDVASQLQGFDPFGGPLGGQAQETLGGLLSTGSPVDVSPITDVAQARAGRTFQDLMGGVNEQFGALGLGSSSARTAELGRQAQNLAQSVGEQGILSGVAAEEAARQRQLGAFSPFQQAQQQQIGAQQAAGGLFGTAGGLQQGAGGLQQGAGNLQLGAGQLNLNQQLQPAQAQTNLAQGLIPVQAGQMNRAPQGAAPGTNFAAPSPFSGGGARGFTGGSIAAPQPFNPIHAIGGKALGSRGLMGTQRGGQVPSGRNFEGGGRGDFGDFLSNLLFGQQFNRDFAPAAPPPIPIPQFQSALGAPQAPVSNTIPGMQMPFNTGLLKSAGPTTNQSAAASQDLLSLIKAMGLASKPSAIAQGFRTGQFIDATPMQKGLGIVGANPNLLRTEDGGKVQKMQQGGDVLGVQGSIANQSPIGDVLGVQGSAMNQLAPVQQQVQEQLGIGLPGMQATGIAGPQMDQISQLLQILMQQQGQQPPSRGRGLMEDGGEVPKGGEVQGPKHPPDQVPIIATGGEVVLDPPTVAMLEAFDGSPEMAMQIVQQVIEVSQRSPEMVGKQFGGPIPTAGSSVANPPGGTASFLQGLDPAAPPDPGQLAIQQAQEARRRADLFRQAAFNSPRGARRRKRRRQHSWQSRQLPKWQ
jgi:hypothetical protein